MAPIYGIPNLNFLNSSEESKELDLSIEQDEAEGHDRNSYEEMAFWYMMVLAAMLLTWMLVFFCIRIITIRHKTRAQPPPRAFPRARQSLTPEPTIYVSPANLPPPPKYECLAPPSYEEVVGIHYPNYPPMPITQPITTAMAQSSSSETNTNNVNERRESTVITVTSERRTSAVAAT